MAENNGNKIIQFDEVKDRIKEALQKKSLKTGESLTLLDGFVSEFVRKELSSSILVGGPIVPMVMLIGNETGQVYLFALKALLPDIEL